MARRPRADSPGSWHHVINRAIAKRPYFETRSDKRAFLARLVSEVRTGRLEVHAFSLMATHFHLLVRSPLGELSEAMRRVQCSYSRYFNRRRHRDGPLIRARFYSKRVDTDLYRRAVVRYIDTNAVRAGVVSTPADEEFASARSFLGGPCPRWLSTEWVVQYALKRSGNTRFDPSTYLRTFGPRKGEDLESLCKLVELRMASTCELDPLEDLLGATPLEVRQWMIRKAHLADGMEIGLPVCGPPAVIRAVDRHREASGEWLVDHANCISKGSQLAQVGLLRDLCSLPLAQIARICEISIWKATRRVDLHHATITEDGIYAANVSKIARDALAATIPG